MIMKSAIREPGEIGRYSTWYLKFDYEVEQSLDSIEIICQQEFSQYRIYRASKRKKKVKMRRLTVIGKTINRKRLSTLKNQILSICNQNVIDFNKILGEYSLVIFRSAIAFEKLAGNN